MPATRFHDPNPRPRRAGFTLVELLIVISVIGIMAALAISTFSNAATDTRDVVVQQQVAVLQEAVNSWVAGQKSVSAARTTYNATADRYSLIAPYLASTVTIFTNTATAGQIQSSAMAKTVPAQVVTFPTWATNSYPQVSITAVP